MNKSFAGKVVLVTGANSGIGETAAALFAEAGATVIGTARRKEALEQARARHPKVKWTLVDVSDAASVKQAVEGVVRTEGRLDVVVNNAGTFAFGPLEQATEAMMRPQFEANVYGTVYVSQAALPALRESKGSIINIGSAAGHKPVPGGSIYGASKAAVESLTRSWALELAPLGVRVNLVAPGPTETPGFNAMGSTPAEKEATKKAFISQVPLGRSASSEEVARWILVLADPSVTWVTGQIFGVDGGMGLT